MSERYPGGVISKTPPTITPPTDGEGGSASGVWTLADVIENEKAGTWPKKLILRELYSWGDGNVGALGTGNETPRSSPVQVGALTTWSSVTATFRNGAAIKKDGTLWAWGDNSSGQVGDNTTISRSSPVQIGALTNWATLCRATRGAHFAVIKTDGTLWTWGSNSDGQLGDNSVINRSSPVQVGSGTNWAFSTTGLRHTVGITTGGELYAWGENENAQLGLGDYTLRSSPVQVGALTNWYKAAAGYNHTLATKTNGTLWAWGYNRFQGALGIGTTAYGQYRKTSPVQVGALTNWDFPSAGTESSAAIKTDNTLWAWGKNNAGQLGDNTRNSRSSPVQIGALTDWLDIESGENFVVALKTDGTLWAWGTGSSGRLGQNNTISRSSPVQTGALTAWSAAAAGDGHVVAILTS